MPSARSRAIQKSTLQYFICPGLPSTLQECATWFCGTDSKLHHFPFHAVHITQANFAITEILCVRDECCCCFLQICTWSRCNLVDSLELRLLHALHILLKPRQVQNLAGHQQPQYDLLDKSPGEAAAEIICFNICMRLRVQQWKLCYEPAMQR